jgi:ubiquinone/menaquinone biosynthesis C-methylase UbiE
MSENVKYTEDDYHKNYYSGLSGKLMRQNHIILEKFNFGSADKILEIGGGFHPHIDFVKHEFKEYYCIDLESAQDLKTFINKNHSKINFNYYDGKKIPFPDNHFERIVISHCLEHILEPEKFTVEMMRVLKKDGIISMALPCDPGVLYRIGRFFFKMVMKKRSEDYDHDYHAACEHVNSIFNLNVILKKKFNVIKEEFYPLKLKMIDLNLFWIIQIRK